jgi:hypothetical protein
MPQEEHKFRVLRRIFRPKNEEVAGSWRKLYDDEAL